MMVVSRDGLCRTDRILPVPVSAVTCNEMYVGTTWWQPTPWSCSHGSAWDRSHVLREAPGLIQKLESCLEDLGQILRPPDFSHPD